MTKAMTLRLDDETARRLSELEAAGASSRSAAVVAAINAAWTRLQEEQLETAYAKAVADSPAYPYEDEDEHNALRARRGRRQRPSS